MNIWIHLASRRTMAIYGAERKDFLQGLVTQDIAHQTSPLLFSAMLNAHGRFFCDFFIFFQDDHLILDYDEKYHDALLERLKSLAPLHASEVLDTWARYAVCAALGPDVQDLLPWTSRLQPDPRHPDMGLRALVSYEQLHILPHCCLAPASEECYHQHRIELSIPDGARDLVLHKSHILEYGYQNIHALSWDKGCYVGQELMAHTHYRAHLKKKLCQVLLKDGGFPLSGTPLYYQGVKVGCMASHHLKKGLMSLDLERLAPRQDHRLEWCDESDQNAENKHLVIALDLGGEGNFTLNRSKTKSV